MLAAVEALRRGQASAAAGRMREAIAAFRQGVALLPDDPAPRIALGQILVAAGYRYDGCASLVAGAALLAGSADHPTRVAVAALLQQQGDPAAALPLATTVAIAEPDNLRARQLVATAAAQLGKGPVALEAAAAAIRLAPSDPALAILSASIAVDFGDAAAAAEGLQRLLAGPLPPREAYRATKELARAQDRIGAHAQVFPTLARAGSFADRVPEAAQLDPARNARAIAADLAELDQARLRRWAGDGPADSEAAPVFVIGFLRSGTTLMQEVLGANPALCVADEQPLLALTVAEFERRHGGPGSRMARLDGLTVDQRAALRAYYRAAAVARLGPEARLRRIVDKFALNLIDLPVVLRLFPDSPVLFMVRDPRDACLSALLQHMVLTEATVNLIEPARAAAFHSLICGAWRQWRDAAPAGQLAEVRYEALVTHFEQTVRAALAHAGIDWTEAMRRFHERAVGRYISSPSRLQVARPLSAGAIGRWRHYAAAFEELDKHLAPSLRAWEYPPA